MRSLVWFRGNDLRLRDHQPLGHALSEGETVFLYVFDPIEWNAGIDDDTSHQSRFRKQAIEALRIEIEALGSHLFLFWGAPEVVLLWFSTTYQIQQILTQRRSDPYNRHLTEALRANLKVPLRLFDGETLLAPEMVRTGSGEPYSVFTAFSRTALRQLAVTRPLSAPGRLPPLPSDLARLVAATPNQPKRPIPIHPEVYVLDRVPESRTKRHDAEGARGVDPVLLSAGEGPSLLRLKQFVKFRAERYDVDRDQLAIPGSSRLSAYLRLGNLSPKQVWWAVDRSVSNADSKRRFLTQLLWREFAYSTLWDRPTLLSEPFQKRFIGFPWRDDFALLKAWIDGRTGYPIVDAASRQLTAEGFVHNRARMIAASFLSKHLLVNPKLGEAHYLKWLADGDPAQNNLGWQWSCGTGCDAQPYFRIFNPSAQAERFDAEGNYVRRYVPELARLPTRYLSRPWETPVTEQSRAGIRIGRDYPLPLVDHAAARNRFLAIAAERFSRST
ncbi:MAG TPA: deoxyribodipyrimidine photo-lyase [Polyangiaceae bacterium]